MALDFRIRDFIMTDPQILQSAFDEAYKAELDVAIGDIEMPLFTLIQAAFKGEIQIGGGRHHAVALLNNALETLISSLQLLRQAATTQGLALLRISLEADAVAIWITSDNEALSQYARRDGNFKSVRAISFTRKKLPQLPEFWGALSQATIHPNVTVFGPLEGPNGSATISFMRRELDPNRDRGALRALSVGAAMLLRAAELALLVDDPGHPGWLRLPGSDIIVTGTAASLLDIRYQAFKSHAYD